MKNITKTVGILLTVLSLVACDNTKETFSKSYSNPFTSKEFVDYGPEITKQEAETVFNGIKDYPEKLKPTKITYVNNVFSESRVVRNAEFNANYPQLMGSSTKQKYEVDSDNLFYHYEFRSKDFKYSPSGDGKGSYIHHYFRYVEEDYWMYYKDGYLQYAHYYFEDLEDNTQRLLSGAKAYKWKVQAKKEDLKDGARFNTLKYNFYFMDGINFSVYDTLMKSSMSSYSMAYRAKDFDSIALNYDYVSYNSKDEGNLLVASGRNISMHKDMLSSFPEQENDLFNVDCTQHYSNRIVDYFSAQELVEITSASYDADHNLIRQEYVDSEDTIIEECDFEYPNLSEYTETDGDWQNPMDDGEKK